MRLSVPGNILLLGEYAVLEEGGRGVAAAVEPRVLVDITRGHGPARDRGVTVTSSWPGRSPLVSAVVEAVGAGAASWAGGAGASFHIDSSAFFDSSGRKTGLGSSAAVAAGLAAALLGPGYPGAEGAGIALAAHRAAQAGRGSGYDVLCSWHGGTGLFTGGRQPAWEPAAFPPGLLLYLFAGPAAVKTSDAVARYAAWKQGAPDAAAEFLAESNRRVAAFLDAAHSGTGLLAAWGSCRDLGVQLGDTIGVDARVPVPNGVEPGTCKSLGAGNELGACLLPADAPRPRAPGLVPVVIATEGVRWQD